MSRSHVAVRPGFDFLEFVNDKSLDNNSGIQNKDEDLERD
jgi:hypothetical protein